LAIPYISIAMIAAVYGLQALIFVIKREFMLIGWMIVILSYPIYSFFLPIYSFWRMDEFGWGNTRVVLDGGSNKKVITTGNDMKFNDSMIPYKKWSDYEAEAYGDGNSNNPSNVKQNPMNSAYLPTLSPRTISVTRTRCQTPLTCISVVRVRVPLPSTATLL